MSHWRLATLGLALFLALFAGPAASLARPLRVDDLAALSVSVQSDLLLRLAERRGLDRALDADDRDALLRAGLTPAQVDRLGLLAQPPVEVDGFAYAVVDGVIRVWAEGSERPEPAAPTAVAANSSQPASAPREGTDPTDDSPEPGESFVETGWSNPHPAGAFGGGVGVVFVPARFGHRPSAFGRTLVTTWPEAPTVCATGCRGGPVVLVPPAPRASARPAGFIPFRTSRGTLWVPN